MIVNERPEMPRCWWKAKVSVWPSMASSSCKLDKIIISDHPLPHHHLNFTEACCHHKFPAPNFSTQFFRPKVFIGKSWGQTFLTRAYHSANASSKLFLLFYLIACPKHKYLIMTWVPVGNYPLLPVDLLSHNDTFSELCWLKVRMVKLWPFL